MWRNSSFKYWKKSGSKYNAKRTDCGLHSHRSGLEAKVCCELQLQQKAGEIKEFKVEHPFELELDGLGLGRYYADFLVTNNDGTLEVVEAKGMELPEFKRKWKIVQHMFRNDPNISFRMVKK